MLNAYNNEAPLILVVDDDVVIRGMLSRLLQDQGYRIVEAENGQQGVERFKEHAPELVLLDAAMPIMSGFDACAAIKALPEGKDIPIIMITSLHDESSVDRGFEAGAVEYITKPVHWAVLRHRLNTLIKARRAEAALIRSEARFRGVFEQAGIGIALTDIKGHLLDTNQALQQMLGRAAEDLLTLQLDELFLPRRSLVEEEFREQLFSGMRRSYQMDKFFSRVGEKEPGWVRMTVSLLFDEANNAEFYLYMLEDISKQKRAQEAARIADKVFENTTDAVLITDAEGHIQDVNQSFVLMTGYSYAELLDKNPRILKSGRHDDEFYTKIWRDLKESGRWRGEIWNQRKSGENYLQWLAISVVRDEYNVIKHYVAVYSNMPSLGKSDEELRKLLSYDEHMYQLTHYDALTELANPLLFQEQLMRICRQGEPLALLNIDLDNFGIINDTLGFEAGDAYLKQVAERLTNYLPSNAMPARLEGDSFAVVLSPINQPYDARLMAEKVLEILAAPIQIDEHSVHVDCHIGISLCCMQPSEPEEPRGRVDRLLQHADLATHLARQLGPNSYKIFSESVLEEFN